MSHILYIPATLSAHARERLQGIDAALVDRVGDDPATREAEALRIRDSLNGRDGSMFYFLGLYARLVKGESQ